MDADNNGSVHINNQRKHIAYTQCLTIISNLPLESLSKLFRAHSTFSSYAAYTNKQAYVPVPMSVYSLVA